VDHRDPEAAMWSFWSSLALHRNGDSRLHDPDRVDNDTRARIVKDSGLWVSEGAKTKVTPALSEDTRR